ncbi:MAG: hypothetical protein ACRDGJ_12190 [Candidatus Limnocylindria bacterium]
MRIPADVVSEPIKRIQYAEHAQLRCLERGINKFNAAEKHMD